MIKALKMTSAGNTHMQALGCTHTHTHPVSQGWPLGVTAWGIPGAIKWEVKGAAESCRRLRMDDCHGRQGRKINSHERGCSHVYSSREDVYIGNVTPADIH